MAPPGRGARATVRAAQVLWAGATPAGLVGRPCLAREASAEKARAGPAAAGRLEAGPGRAAQLPAAPAREASLVAAVVGRPVALPPAAVRVVEDRGREGVATAEAVARAAAVRAGHRCARSSASRDLGVARARRAPVASRTVSPATCWFATRPVPSRRTAPAASREIQRSVPAIHPARMLTCASPASCRRLVRSLRCAIWAASSVVREVLTGDRRAAAGYGVAEASPASR